MNGGCDQAPVCLQRCLTAICCKNGRFGGPLQWAEACAIFAWSHISGGFQFQTLVSRFPCGYPGPLRSKRVVAKEHGVSSTSWDPQTTSGIRRGVLGCHHTKKTKKRGTTGRQRISKRFPDDFLSRMFEMPRVGTTPWVRRSNNHPKFRRPRCPLHCCTHAKRGPLGLRSGEAASPSSFSEVRCVICDGCVRRYNNKGRPPRSATLSPSPLPLIHPAEAAHTPAPLYPLGLELLLAVRTPFATSIDGTTRFSPTCDFRSRSSRTWSPTLLSFFSSSRQTKHSSVVPAFLLSCVVTKKGRDRKRNRQTRTALHTGRLTKWELVSRQLANSKKSRGVPKEGRKR